MVRRWAAARPLAVGAACCRCVAPLVFRVPSGPAARAIATREPAARSGRSRSPPVPSGPSGALHTGDDWRAGVWLSASSRSPPVPSGPSGALHTGGTCGAWTSPARPCCQSHFTPSRRTLIVESAINFACNSLIVLSNHEFRLLELQRFQTLLKLLPIELHATFLRPGSAVTFRLRGQALRLEVCSVPPVSATVGVLPGVT